MYRQNAQVAESKQLQDVAPELLTIVNSEYSVSVRERIKYELSYKLQNSITFLNKLDEVNKDENGNYVPKTGLYDILNAITWETTGTKLHKRIRSVVYRLVGYSMDETLLRWIADVAATERNDVNLWIDCTTSLDWEDGDFGDSGSCYFDTGMYNHVRVEYLPKLGGSAIRSYRTSDTKERGRGNGRYWVFPLPLYQEANQDLPIYVAYNPYGAFKDFPATFVASATRVAEIQHGRPFKAIACDFSMDGGYVNGHSVSSKNNYLVYPADLNLDELWTESLCDELTILRMVNGDWKVRINGSDYDRVGCDLPEWAYYEANNGAHCDNCGHRFNPENEGYCDDYGHEYCDDCYSELFGYCEICDETCSNDDITEVDGHSVCNSCRDHHCGQCDLCQEWHITDLPRRFQNRNHGFTTTDFVGVVSDGIEANWCASCFENDSFYCDHCNQYHDTNYMDAVHMGRETYCQDCADELREEEEEVSEEETGNFLSGHVLITDIKDATFDHDYNLGVSTQSGQNYVVWNMFGYRYSLELERDSIPF